MFGIHDLALFVLSGLLLNLLPGPDTLLVMTHSASRGWRAGSAVSLGIGSGILLHVLAAALGLSAILASSATAFSLVKYAGAAYLVYLGLMALLQRSRDPAPAGASHPLPARPRTLGAIFWQGFCCNALNPKVALFFLAFVPQFISLDSPDKPQAFVVLGLIFDVNSMLWCHLLVLVTTRLSQRLRLSGALRRWLGKSIGALLVSLGVKLALTTQG